MGSDLARLTVPIGFTGKKGRKLVVKVVEKANPPWGYLERPFKSRRKTSYFYDN
ncbi:MAG: hypothetical protein ACOX2N_09375 [Peptococcia bacterium]